MGFSLVPDYVFSAFHELTVDFLKEQGICGVILDIDNTLEPYENAYPGERVKEWLTELKNAGISYAFVSNNNKERVDTFNNELGAVAFHKAGKPFKKNVIKAMYLINCNKSNTILMGDQILTDVWAARNAGISAVLVPPINDKKDLFTKFKRLLEKPILKRYRKREGKNK